MADTKFVFESVPEKQTDSLEEALAGLAEPFRTPLLDGFGQLEQAIKISKNQTTQRDLRATVANYLSHPTLGVIHSLELMSHMDDLGYHNDNFFYPHTMGHVLLNFIKIATGEVLKRNYKNSRNAILGVMAAAGHDLGFSVNDGNRNRVRYYDRNEPIGAAMAENYMLTVGGFSPEEIYGVIQPIQYTYVRKNLKRDNEKGIIIDDNHLNAQALGDADLSYLADPQRIFFGVEHELKEEVYARQFCDLYGISRSDRELLINAYIANGNLDAEELVGTHGKKQHKDFFDVYWSIVSFNFINNVHHWNTPTAKKLFYRNTKNNVEAYHRRLLNDQESFERTHDLNHVDLAKVFPGYFPELKQ